MEAADFPGGSAVRNLSAMQEKWDMGVRSLGWEDPLDKNVATHSSILARKLPWTKELGKLSSMGSQSQTQLKQLSKHAWEGQTGFLEGSLASWDFPSTTFPWGCSTWRNAGSHQSPTCPQCVQASCLLLPTPQPQQPLLSKILGSCLCVCSAASNSLQPHGLQPTRFPCPWNFLGRNTGVGCHALFQEIFPTQGLNPHILSPALAGGFFTTSAT